MEQPNTIPVVSKKIWSIVRVLFYMIRKGISNRKLLVDLKMMMKRGKIAGKAIHNLMFHHHHSSPSSSAGHVSFYGQREYEFSCSNTPTAAFPFHLMKRNKGHGNGSSHFFPCAHAPPTEDDRVLTVDDVRQVLEMMERTEAADNASPMTAMATPMSSFWQSPAARDLIYSELSSPALPGFGRTPMARQLRITDSPFPLRDGDSSGDSHVDEAAEEFISRFYKELKKQNKMGTLQR
ncbi:hypothetical protein RHMOL_Rhmol08G0301800 [Rhododendron molle]|uniref:Uncharacterized protein n=1 Tax=Rhododendron molle TaxID=49168 RepID=A0ACC0MVF2_RHOML|nr:hypothetical protein RHMOL_Rhmol08G0301800 [Rhododendron molle]